ncbi:MAG: TlpA family protein disulfide reductase [Bacteroidetes bacterium]|nr:TlpA family protein disulfide reductase [Bacteroidota bacterium]
MTITKRFSYLLLVMILCGIKLRAQEKQTLQVGDPAPELSYAKWVQGPEPIKQLDKNNRYVLEFWATWCGPCIQAMPHLSELSKKYDGRIAFIGCDVWENTHGGPKEQESYAGKVASFVQDQYKMGRLTYNVIMDNNAEHMGNQWLKAAGIGGIPTTFLIDKGRIAWIGHPLYVDSIITLLLAGKYDVQAERDKRIARAKKEEAMSAGYKAAIKAYKDAEEAKDFARALALVDSAIAKFPSSSYMFVTDKFKILLKQYGEDSAIGYGRQLQKERLAGQVLVANLYTEGSPSKKVNEFAAESTKAWGESSKILDIRASFLARAGHYKEAAETQVKAVQKAKEEKDNPAVTPSVIEEYQQRANEYQQKVKENH